jgi:hypothetical protein
MVARFVAVLFAASTSAAIALAQSQSSSGVPARSIEAQPLMPLAPAAETTPPPAAAPPPAAPAAPPPAVPMSEPIGRIFCEQPVTVRLADPETVAERFRPFIGIWSDASWTPVLCAALIVENVAPDGTATILYVFGPMGAGGRAAGGVLQGTGIIRDGELRFQNSDGSQFAFRPLYADLDGRLTTPKEEGYHAVFKKTP